MEHVMPSSDSNPSVEASMLVDIASGLHLPRRIVLPLSWAGHIPFASWIMRTLRPHVVVELGVHTGNSFFTFAEAAVTFDLPSQLYGIDTWAGDEHAGSYAEEVFVEVDHVARTRFPNRVHLLRKMFDDAIDDFADGSIDLLHIDGLHTYDAVRHDFESWRPKLSGRAVVLFHDIAVVEPGFGVAQFWNEIQREFATVSFVHSNGLGVLLFGNDVPPKLRLIAEPAPLKSGVVELFVKLGEFLLSVIRLGPEAGALPVNAFLDPPNIYLAIDGVFDENRVVEAKPVPGLPGTLHAVLPPIDGGNNVVLRIDPANHVGMRAVHRIVLAADGPGAPVELVAAATDRRERLTIVPVEAGFVFLATGEDSQWYPGLSEDAIRLLRGGATIVFEPITVPLATLSRMLLASAQVLAAPLEERLAELSRLEHQQLFPTFADAVRRIGELEKSLAEASAQRGAALAEIDTAAHRHESLARDIEALEARLILSEATLAESAAHRSELERRLVEGVAGRDAALAEITAANLRLESLARDVEELRAQVTLSEGALAESAAHRSELETQLGKMASECNAALSASAAAQKRADDDAASLSDARQRIEALTQRIEEREAQISHFESATKRFETEAAAHGAAQVAISAFAGAGPADRILTSLQVEAKLLALDKLVNDRDPGIARTAAVLATLFKANEIFKGRSVILDAKCRQKASTSPIRKCFLEPKTGLAPLDQEGRRWHATDTDPQFSFETLTQYAGRWVAVTIGLVADERGFGGPVLYLDTGEGMSEATKMLIPKRTRDASNVSVIFYVPPGLRGARFDPCSSPIEFTLTQVDIESISKWQAMRRMAIAMEPSGRLKKFRSTYLPQWRSWGAAPARQGVKEAFVASYRETLFNGPSDYTGWIDLFEPHRSSYASLAAQRVHWERLPLISVVMPTYNTPAAFLREAIKSVLDQNYPRWELCIADDASTAKHVRSIVAHYAKTDPRIKVTYRQVNGHISAASNSALELATGEFIALLDHDDLLHPLALHYVAEAILHNPSAKLIYTDEDKLNEAGVRQAPYFKCDFNPELFLAQNLVTHLGCYDAALVRQLGGFRIGVEGSQDWDLALRVYEASDVTQIVHIPRVLYHWRELIGSTALSIDQKPYIQAASRRAVEDHLKRREIDARVLPAPGLPMWNRVRYTLPAQPQVTIVIPTRDKVDVLRKAVDSVLALTTYPNYDIVIVDNGSVEPETRAYLDALPSERVHVIRDDSPFNYSRINNDAVRQSKGELICLLNNDVEAIDGDWLEEMVSMAHGQAVGIVGARLWYPDMRLQHGGVVLGVGGVAGHAHRLMPRGEPGYFGRAVLQQQLSAVTGACLLIKRSVWNAIDGLDEKLGVAFNDIDLCLRAGEIGFRTVWTPYAELIHYESVSRGAEDTPEKISRFNAESELMYARWGNRLLTDPFYSPNLTLTSEDFSFSWEPRTPAACFVRSPVRQAVS